MALISMTGYGRGEHIADGVHAVVEMSTVNRKQLDVCLRLPKALALLEPKVYDMIKGSLHRGRVSGELSLTYTGRARSEAVNVDEELATLLVKKLRAVGEKLDLKDNLSIRDLLDMPDVVKLEENKMDPDLLWSIASKALAAALKQLVSMRQNEGLSLQKDLTIRVERMQALTQKIAELAPGIAKKYQAQLLDRLKNAGVDLDDFEGRLFKEIALYADKCDITEEITRLQSHCEQVNARLADEEPVGRAMDFLAQEMFREINTIGSKANDAPVIALVVEFKSEVEKFREQVQNVE